MDRIVLNLAVSCLRGQKSYDDCNPEFGMSPGLSALLDRVEISAAVRFTTEERIKILLAYRDKYGE